MEKKKKRVGRRFDGLLASKQAVVPALCQHFVGYGIQAW